MFLYSHPEEREQFLIDLGRQGQVLNYECKQRRQDGTMFWILERATIVTDPDGNSFIEGTAIDITERKQSEIALKQSEERFATIFRQSPVGCGIVSLDGVFLNVNENLLRMLALPAEKVIGKTAVELGLWRSQSHRDEFYRRLRAEGAIQNLEIRFKDANGVEHIGLYFATLVRIGDKECIFGMQLDQTEERALEAKFLQAQKMEALGRLAGGVAHDFNNLLGVIGGYAELLESKLENDEDCAAIAARSLTPRSAPAALPGNCLPSAARKSCAPCRCKPARRCRNLPPFCRRLIGEDIELSVNLRATGTVVIDKTHFEQIIFNIVINSRDAMPGGRPDIYRNAKTSCAPCSLLPAAWPSASMWPSAFAIPAWAWMKKHACMPLSLSTPRKRWDAAPDLGLATVYGIVQQCRGEICH